MAKTQTPDPIRGIAAGLAAGLIASLAMSLFQKGWNEVVPMPDTNGDPATVKASRAANGKSIAKRDKPAAGEAVHYLFGAALGATYGLLAEYKPEVTAANGAWFGTMATAFDEIGVPLAGLSEPPSEFGPATHAYAFVSHALFGVVAEFVRFELRVRD
jgi:uncharacterized membrane protein YagU involved in acid resistance